MIHSNLTNDWFFARMTALWGDSAELKMYTVRLQTGYHYMSATSRHFWLFDCLEVGRCTCNMKPKIYSAMTLKNVNQINVYAISRYFSQKQPLLCQCIYIAITWYEVYVSCKHWISYYCVFLSLLSHHTCMYTVQSYWSPLLDTKTDILV